MALKVYKYGEKVLREKAVAVASVDDSLRAFADEMLETMRAAKGVGLAAQQVGRTERMCVIDIPPDCEEPEDGLFNAPIRMPLKMWNPAVVAVEGSQRDKEGCLSFPGIGGSLTRAAQVTVTYVDENNVTINTYVNNELKYSSTNFVGETAIKNVCVFKQTTDTGVGSRTFYDNVSFKQIKK
jgi:peptide deformylase